MAQKGYYTRMSFTYKTHVFIIRIWAEPREIEQATPEWRGLIEYVPTGQKYYFKSLDEMVAFIGSYTDSMGMKPGLRWRLQRWLRW
jgi:hypothetical protein